MEMTINIPVVSGCAVSECAYNVDKRCHARAITIGDGIHPGCDTFLGASKHIHDKKQIAGVGACKVAACLYNEDLECAADEVEVGHHGKDINCLTFTPS
jgi:hypothetical protein